MERRTFLLGLLGALAAAPAIIAAASSVEAAPAPEAASPSPLSEADLEALQADWAQAVAVPGPARRRVRRGARRVGRTARRTRRVMRRRGYRTGSQGLVASSSSPHTQCGLIARVRPFAIGPVVLKDGPRLFCLWTYVGIKNGIPYGQLDYPHSSAARWGDYELVCCSRGCQLQCGSRRRGHSSSCLLCIGCSVLAISSAVLQR